MRTPVEIDAEYRKVGAVKCPHCGAAPGRWCKDFTGTPARKLHVKRMRAAGVDVPKSRVR